MKPSNGQNAETVLQPDCKGWSEAVLMEQFESIGLLAPSNGPTWSRTDRGYLADKYNVINIHQKELTETLRDAQITPRKPNAIAAIQLQGFRKNPTLDRIAPHIRKALKDQPSAFSGIRHPHMVVDHKDGYHDDYLRLRPENQKVEDFQNLSQAENKAKGTACARCKETGIRYDARPLGYTCAQYVGESTYKSCVGCFWYDPITFRATVSKDFIPIVAFGRDRKTRDSKQKA